MENVISFPVLGLSFHVSRAAITIGDFSIYWYGLLIGLGLALAIVYGVRECGKTGLSTDDLLNMLLIALPVAIICARLYYVIFSWDMYRGDLYSIFDIRSGGLAVYGGIIGACAVIIIYCRIKKINLGIVLDILAVGLLIGQSIGRWGNFLNGEAFGSVTSLPWGMTIVSDGKTIAECVHPTFLYESLWNSLGLILLLLYKKKCTFRGELFCSYMIWYGFGRMLIESLRTDSLYLGSIRISQLVAAVFMLSGIILIITKKRKQKSTMQN